MTWRTLPIEGLKVNDITVFGDGKDCQVTIRTHNSKKGVEFMMRDPELKIELQGRVKTIVFNDGHDCYLGVKYVPQEDLLLEVCKIQFPGDKEEWDAGLIDFENGDSEFIGWTISSAKIRMAPTK